MFTERKSSLTQNIQVEGGRHIFSGHGGIFLKNDIHRPMLAYCVGKAVYIRQGGNKKRASVLAAPFLVTVEHT